MLGALCGERSAGEGIGITTKIGTKIAESGGEVFEEEGEEGDAGDVGAEGFVAGGDGGEVVALQKLEFVGGPAAFGADGEEGGGGGERSAWC